MELVIIGILVIITGIVLVLIENERFESRDNEYNKKQKK